MSITALDIFLGSLGLVLLKLWHNATKSTQGPLPPGPKPLPLIGNLLDMPTSQPWYTFADWGRKYGDMVTIDLFGQKIIIVNSAKVAAELLNERSTIYSDRPRMHFAESLDLDKVFTLSQYGDAAYRAGRKHSSRLMGSPAAIKMYSPAQELEALKFVRRVLDRPESLIQHIRTTAGSLVLRVIYGYETQEHDDPFIKITEEGVDVFARATEAGAWLVDTIPALDYLPSWMPGAGFKKTAAEWRVPVHRFVNAPLEYVKQQIAAGTAQPSFVETLLSENLTPEEELKWTAATISGGGGDTSVGQIYAFFLAMILHPEVLKKAQAEMDSVTHGERLPAFSDRESLPYVNALVNELFRWHSLIPSCVPHKSNQDDVYQGSGFFFPKGTLIIPNIWGITHNPDIYPDPLAFKPERFLNVTLDAADQTWFGFGRRICPGMHLANAAVWIACASALAVFDITRALDENGNPITPKHEYITGTISHPVAFPYSIKPRSEAAVALVRNAAELQL